MTSRGSRGSQLVPPNSRAANASVKILAKKKWQRKWILTSRHVANSCGSGTCARNAVNG